MIPLVWRKSSRSANGTGQCVEAASLPDGVAVRDSKDKTGPILTCDRAAWVGFLAGLR